MTVRLIGLGGGHSLETLVVGHGSTHVPFIHGLGGSPRFFQLLQQSAALYDLTWHAVWLPNHGRSSDMTDYRDVIAALEKWSDLLELGRCPWVGHSIGGYLAAAMAVEHPELASSVVTMAAPIGAPFDVRPLTTQFLAPRLAYLVLEGLGPVHLAMVAQAAWSRRLKLQLAAEVELMRRMTRFDKAIPLLNSAPVLLDRMAASSVPMTHIYGSLDPVVRPNWVVPGTVQIIKGGLHSFPIMSGRKTMPQLIQHLASGLGLTPVPA